ncbi:MAG: Glutaredoxin-like protein, YruB-family [Parcubacteria group bacterium GW2011_GWA1_Parcubacteria_45_10]|nr:MAG: Glutaredoxin-like protein, YruB-family [Parcubacteria group bacterium GW2011_GWA1_Parcubacteria_45_10]
MTVKIYSTPTCAYCAMAKEFMKSKNIAYQEFDVVSDVQAREEMIKKTGQMGVPVIDVDGKVMVGFNQKVLADLLGIKE